MFRRQFPALASSCRIFDSKKCLDFFEDLLVRHLLRNYNIKIRVCSDFCFLENAHSKLFSLKKRLVRLPPIIEVLIILDFPSRIKR